jgi:hypothetical protein
MLTIPPDEARRISANIAKLPGAAAQADLSITVRRLERVYGKDIVRAEYERLAQDH